MLEGLWDHLAVCVTVYAPSFFVLRQVRVASKKKKLVLPTTSCLRYLSDYTNRNKGFQNKEVVGL
jgi:hypothetical protein